MQALNGRIHGIESCAAADGPGLRSVVFMQGCPLRCAYCHNPDARPTKTGAEMSVDAVYDKVMRFANYWGADGGVTISGGEPLLQSHFVGSVLARFQDAGVHTALDTSGYYFKGPLVESVLDKTNVVLLDVKHSDPDLHIKLCKTNLSRTFAFLRLLHKRQQQVWIRHVVIPEHTASAAHIKRLGELLSPYKDVIQRVDLLPFHHLGDHKWSEEGACYTLADIPEPTEGVMDNAAAILADAGLPVSRACA